MQNWKKIGCVAVAALSFGAIQGQTVINGAGASFPAPVYQLWTYHYSKVNPETQINYQSLGSGAGINQIKAGTIDFAGTDNPLSPEELKKEGLVQFPMLAGGVVLIVNLPNVKSNQLQLDQTTLSNIFLGKITRWDDPAIAALNPKMKLPKLKITVVRRADSSGTSFIFTSYLSKISPEWKETVGAGPAVNWPCGLGGQKNPGVCNNVAKIRGSIGYTEYTYAEEAKLATVMLKNQAGEFVAPSPKTFTAGAAHADWENAPGFVMELTEPAGKDSWPITGITYILLREDAVKSPEKLKVMLDYFAWCRTEGAAGAAKLLYVPLPEQPVGKLVVEMLTKTFGI